MPANCLPVHLLLAAATTAQAAATVAQAAAATIALAAAALSAAATVAQAAAAACLRGLDCDQRLGAVRH